MITDFMRQTCASVGDFLHKVGHRKRTYSAHLKGVYPFDNDTSLYIYATKHEVVVVVIDMPDGLTTETVNEQGRDGKAPRYRFGRHSRVSPVYTLKCFMDTLQQRIREQANPVMPKLWGVLVTSVELRNKADYIAAWGDMRVSVFDRQDSSDYAASLPTNNDEQLYGSRFLECYSHQIVPDRIDVDVDFERMLNDFILSESEHKDTAADEEPDDDAPGQTDDNGTDDEDDDAPTSGFDELELNPNNIVKVEVLYPMSHPEREMEKLVGCYGIKKHIDELITLNEYNQRLLQLNPRAKVHELSLHSLFLGRPGTGKTTVCKIMGSLLHQAGMLSSGHVVVANRGTFVGSNWGDEERAVRQVIEKAKGGVLMIDEAYLLNGDNRNDPAKMVLPMLMDILANEKERDLAIVLCGYKQPMLRLLELNPGLESRFPNRFEFEDFSVDELLDITRRRVGEYDYTFTPPAWELYKSVVVDAYSQRDPQTWGNARFIANQLERIYLTHAQRIVRSGISDREQLFSITPADIQPIPVPRQHGRIGF